MTQTVPGSDHHSHPPHTASMWEEAENVHAFGPHGIVLIRILFGLIALGLAFAPLFVAHQLRVAEQDEKLVKPVVGQHLVTPPARPVVVGQAQR